MIHELGGSSRSRLEGLITRSRRQGFICIGAVESRQQIEIGVCTQKACARHSVSVTEAGADRCGSAIAIEAGRAFFELAGERSWRTIEHWLLNRWGEPGLVMWVGASLPLRYGL